MSFLVRRTRAPLRCDAPFMARAAWMLAMLPALAAAQAPIGNTRQLLDWRSATIVDGTRALGGEFASAGGALLSQASRPRVPRQEASPTLRELIGEALKHNPEIIAALHERDAASHRVAPAGALDDPMLEAGFANLPIDSLRFNREDMTMKMLGIAQRLPYPGKRGLRQDVASKDAEAVAYASTETVNRVVREVKMSYYDLALINRSIELVARNKSIVEQLLRIAEARYSVGQGAQADVLKAQTQLVKMTEELVKMNRERRVMEADLNKILGRTGDPLRPKTEMPGVEEVPLHIEALQETALRERPQLLGLRAIIDKNQRALDLARKDYYPDFDVRLSYGQREKSIADMPRPDMISLSVAINLPIWRTQKLEPKIAEAQAMREQAISVLQAQQNELAAKLRQQVAIAEQSRESAKLYESGILPQARLAFESTLSAYRVNRVDFLTLLDSQMAVLNYEVNHAGVVVSYNKALAEIDQLVGRSAPEAR